MAMTETDGRDPTRDFYQSMFSDRIYGKQSTSKHYYERSARAPREVVVLFNCGDREGQP
jgi:hypothetical protein